MQKRVVITGMAMTSPLGSDVKSSFDRLHTLENCIQYDKTLEIYKGLHTRLDARVKDFVLPPDFTRKTTRTMGDVAIMSVVTAKEALEDAGLLGSEIITSGQTGVAYGSCSGSIDAIMDFYSMCVNHEVKNLNSGSYIRMMSHTSAVNISLYFKTHGRIIPTSTACTSGSMAIGYAYEAIKSGTQTVMIAGGAEEHSPSNIGVFDTLFATSVKNDTPNLTPSPFDKDRDGLVIGSVDNAGEICMTYARAQNSNISQRMIDSLRQIKRTRYYPIRGKVSISSTPESTVIIDGIEYGRTPITIDSLPIGSHQLELSAKLHTTLTREINVEEDIETTYYLRLKHSCVATILTDMPGDQVYMDMEFIGKTPVTIEKPFGTYSIYIVRPGHFGKNEEITLSPDNLEPIFDFPFGQIVNVETGDRKAKLYLDGEYMGRAPQEMYIYNGTHALRAEYGWTLGEQDINVTRNTRISNINIETQMQGPGSFLKNGAFFLTGNLGFLNKGGKTAYGFNIGGIAKGAQAGWYFNIMTNTDFISQIFNNDFSVLNAYLVTNENNTTADSPQNTYYGENSLIRASAMFGVALKVVGPVYLRVSGGYGIRREVWKDSYGSWVINDPVSWNSFEGSLGVQCCIYNIVFNTDVLIPVREVLSGDKKLVEFRVGLGFCLKHKR